VNLGADYKHGTREVKRFGEKDKFLLQALGISFIFFYFVPLRRKGRSTLKFQKHPDFASYGFHHAGPAAEPGHPQPRLIGNHLKNSRCEFRIVNHSFTPAWKCWPRTKAEKE